jgi:hypothetical protein
MWTALAIRLFVVIKRSVSVTFKAVKPGRCVRPPRPPRRSCRRASEAELARLHAKIGQLVIEKDIFSKTNVARRRLMIEPAHQHLRRLFSLPRPRFVESASVCISLSYYAFSRSGTYRSRLYHSVVEVVGIFSRPFMWVTQPSDGTLRDVGAPAVSKANLPSSCASVTPSAASSMSLRRAPY